MNKKEHTLPEGYYNSQYHTYLHYTEDSFMDCNPKSYKYILQLEEQIENLQKKAELGDHYKHLYNEVKKQKDDVVEYIKKNILIDYDKYGFDKNIVAGIVVNVY